MKKQRDVKQLIATSKFNQYVAVKSFGGIDYLQVGESASAIASWQAAYDTVAALVVVPETVAAPTAEAMFDEETLNKIVDAPK